MRYNTETITLRVKTDWDKVHKRYKWYSISMFALVLLFLLYLLLAFQIKNRVLRFFDFLSIGVLTLSSALVTLLLPIVHFKCNFKSSGYLKWMFTFSEEDPDLFKKELQTNKIIWLHVILQTILLSLLGASALVFAIFTAKESLFRSLVFVSNGVLAFALGGTNFFWGRWIIKESYYD